MSKRNQLLVTSFVCIGCIGLLSLLLLANRTPPLSQATMETSSSPPPQTPEIPSTTAEVPDKEESKPSTELDYGAHVFYYSWYGAPKTDGKWIHWNHRVLEKDGIMFQPPDEIGANFYPSLGPYSSNDHWTLRSHMEQIASAGVGVVCLSWWGRGKADEQGGKTDETVLAVMDAAEERSLQVSWHLEPYPGRSPESVAEDFKYIVKQYGNHNAFHRRTMKDGSKKPVVFLYDSYLISAKGWASVFKPSGKYSVRKSEYDMCVIGLMVNPSDKTLMVQGGFDGFYNYFATNGFTFGSTRLSWPQLNTFAQQNDLIFIPSVGPGYSDLRIRPWNGKNQRSREGGMYYDSAWKDAVALGTQDISVTSFNEWHEGTQIEKATPHTTPAGFVYENYLPLEEDYYLKRTQYWLKKRKE